MFPDQSANWRGGTPIAMDTSPMPTTAMPNEVQHLQYLVTEMGLSPKTALMLLQLTKPENNAAAADIQVTRSYHDTLARTILAELEADLSATITESIPPVVPVETSPGMNVPVLTLKDNMPNSQGPIPEEPLTQEVENGAEESFKPLSDYIQAVMGAPPE